MTPLRAIVCTAALVTALVPFAASASTTGHAQDELANGEAQWTLAQQEAQDLQAQAQQDASNERMIALLKSEAMRARQLDLVANANAMEQIAASLANAARANGDVNAQNELAIAQTHAAALLVNVDGNLANARMLAQTKGRYDELLNAQAQSDLLHRVANFITSQQAETKMSNAKIIGQEQADAIHTPAIAQQQNGIAMGANELLAADTALQAGALAATSVTITYSIKSSALLGHAAASLANAKAMAGVQ
jgi:hypothetical protein